MTIQYNETRDLDYLTAQFDAEEEDRQDDIEHWAKEWDEDTVWEDRQRQIEAEKEMAWDMLQNMQFEPLEEQAFWEEQASLL
jgi:hypothetical protein